MKCFVVNNTGVPVHVRLDEVDGSAKMFRLTFSREKVGGGRPLTHFILATRMPYNVTFLDGRETEYVIDDRIGLIFDEFVDSDGDYRIDIDGFIN